MYHFPFVFFCLNFFFMFDSLVGNLRSVAFFQMIVMKSLWQQEKSYFSCTRSFCVVFTISFLRSVLEQYNLEPDPCHFYLSYGLSCWRFSSSIYLRSSLHLQKSIQRNKSSLINRQVVNRNITSTHLYLYENLCNT